MTHNIAFVNKAANTFYKKELVEAKKGKIESEKFLKGIKLALPRKDKEFVLCCNLVNPPPEFKDQPLLHYMSVVELPDNRIATTDGKQIRIHSTISGELLLTIDVPSTKANTWFNNLIVVGDKIVSGTTLHVPNDKNLYSTVVFDSKSGKILTRREESIKVSRNEFVLSAKELFVTYIDLDLNMETMYLWNIETNLLSQIGTPLPGMYTIIRKVISLPNERLAIYIEEKVLFYNKSSLTTPYLEVILSSEDEGMFYSETQMEYLPSDIIIIVKRNNTSHVNCSTGEVLTVSFLAESLRNLPTSLDRLCRLSAKKAAVSTLVDEYLQVMVSDIETGKIEFILSPLSSYPIKGGKYFAIGLLPDSRLASVYYGCFLVITNLITNEHEQVILLDKDVISEHIFVSRDGSIIINYGDVIKIWKTFS
jgi:hypothetical protein